MNKIYDILEISNRFKRLAYGIKKILKSSYTNVLKRIKNSNFNTVLSIQYTIINVFKKK